MYAQYATPASPPMALRNVTRNRRALRMAIGSQSIRIPMARVPQSARGEGVADGRGAGGSGVVNGSPRRAVATSDHNHASRRRVVSNGLRVIHSHGLVPMGQSRTVIEISPFVTDSQPERAPSSALGSGGKGGFHEIGTRKGPYLASWPVLGAPDFAARGLEPRVRGLPISRGCGPVDRG